MESARQATRHGVWAAIIVAVVTTVLAVLSLTGSQLFGLDLWALIDAALFAVIAWGIHKVSRTAAVMGLGLYIIERASMWLTYGPHNLVLPILFTLMFINAIRGTFAYHNYLK